MTVMAFLKEFHYYNISQRKLLNVNIFLSFTILAIVLSNAYLLLKYYSFYSPALKTIIILGTSGLLLGNVMGKLIFSNKVNHRFIYIFSELAFIVLFILYTVRNIFMPDSSEIFITLFFSFKYSIPALLFVTVLLFGIKLNYSIRVSSGNFIDKKQGIENVIGWVLCGVSAGVFLSLLLYSLNIPLLATAPLGLLLVPSVFMIDLPYRPASYFTKDYEEEKDRDGSSQSSREHDASLFMYLNVVCIVVYAYLGGSSISRHYGDQIFVTMAFLVLFFILMAAGYGAARFIKASNLYVYGESFFPVAFLIFLVMLMSFSRQIHFAAGIMLFAPMALLLGIVLHHSISAVINSHDSDKRATIIEFSLLIVPGPVLVSLSLVGLTNLWFYVILCIIMIINVVVPAISIVNSSISGYKKGIYFFLSLFFLPLFIFMILFFRISLDNNVYVTRVEHFEKLTAVNYNADYIRGEGTVTMNGRPVFVLSDSEVRNHKRSLVPVVLYHPEGKRMLFIDGNQRFFRNPVIGYFKYSLCLDELSDRDVDYNKLPISGSQKYIPDSAPLLAFFEKNRNRYHSIIDIPNLLDQDVNAFRFSGAYYAIVKKYLEAGGVFAQVYNIPGCRPELLSMALTSLKHSFKRHAIFFFSNIMIVFASDNDKSLMISRDSYERLIGLLNRHEDLNRIFMDETHVLAHLAGTCIDDIPGVIPGKVFFPGLCLAEPGRVRFKKSFLDAYVANNKKFFNQIDSATDERAFLQTLETSFMNNDAIISLLKKTELAEARQDYHEETKLLFDLKKQAEFRITLQSYVLKMLAYKEKYYYSAALNLEKNKKWSEAQELYRAVLTINPDNFNAHYRMALVCITLQDIEGSFKYLQQAMRINRDHPRVLMQMGVLYFSSGKTDEAIEYFNKALQQNERTPQIFRYLGMCHEKAGNLYEAESNYARALAADPNDIDTKARLDEVRLKIDKDSKKWETPEQKNEFDVEQDAEMPLPVSKGAYEIRLKDDDMTLPLIDPITGEEIKTDKNEGDSAQGKQNMENKPRVPDVEKN